MILEPKGLAPLPTHCEAGVVVVHTHIYPFLAARRVALCVSFEEETAVDRTQSPGLKGYVTDLETAETFEIRGFPNFETSRWSEIAATRVPRDSREIQ